MAPPRSLAGAAIAATAAAIILSCLFYRRKCARLAARVRELEASLAVTAEKAAAERRGRVRAQQSLRALSQLEPGSDEARPTKAAASASYPLVPIGTVESCFSTRNGTPRQPLVVTLARATLVLDPARVPAAALEGLASYSHCWILYVFHLNTDLDKLWKDPARSKLKAKVRVPRLKGGKMGVLATRSPHRPNPIGLSVAKVSPEMVQCLSSILVAFWNTLRKSILGLRNYELLVTSEGCLFHRFHHMDCSCCFPAAKVRQ
ncbi:Protein virR [Zea mays]|uniref:Protein virR n=1 Tax=Zea mays TaxID=4577 RepID=A0A1D6I4Q9_MAIZE|nr:Protein virR [Zea mays]